MILRLAAPAILLSSLLLLPFLDKPFTIDDPLFLRAAQHALIDPLHPADFEQVWNRGDRLRLSQYWLGGTLPAYVLMPVAALGAREWIAHLYQWLFLCVFLLGCVAVARRLGCDRSQCTIVALLAGANPVTLAMASTCMPDLMAATFAAVGIERVLAFREQRRAITGIGAALLLAAAILCRATTAPLLLVAALLMTPSSWKQIPQAMWPAAAAVAIAAAGALVHRDTTGAGSLAGSFQTLTGLRNVPRNAVSYFAYQAATGPILLYWMLARGRRTLLYAGGLVLLGLALTRVPSENLRQYAVPGALAICFLVALVDLLEELRHFWPLALWLLCGLIALPYVYMSAKYLLPGIPAAALLVVFHAARVRQRRLPVTVGVLVAAGWIAGALVVVGDTTLAASGRAAAEREVGPILARGGKVWAGGQWSFLEYAQRAGAHPLANQPPFPRPGDYVLISRLDYFGDFDTLRLQRQLLYSTRDERCGVFVLNRPLHAGFFSNRFGYLPFAVGCAELNRYDMYRVLDTLKN